MLGGKRGQQVPRAAGLRPGDPPPPRAGPSPDAHPHQLAGSSARWTWPGPPRCPPPRPCPSPSPAHHSEALLASRLRSLGSKNSRHLGAETDGRRWPRPSASWHTAGWQQAGQTSVAPVWPGASLAVEEAGNVAGGPRSGPATPLMSTPQAPAVERGLCCRAAGPHAGASAHCTPRAGPVTCLVCASCSSRQCPPPARGKDLRS